MRIKRLINTAMIEEVSFHFDAIRSKYIIKMRMASGAVADISFTQRDEAETEYKRLKPLFSNVEIIDNV